MSSMSVIATRGIIVKRRNYKEADRIVTIFTRSLGVITAQIRGVRKTTSKLAGHSEPFMIIDLRLAEGHSWYTVTHADTITSFDTLRTNLHQTSSAYYLAELICVLFQNNDPHPQLYDLFEEMLGLLNKGKNGLLLPSFLWHVMAEIGYSPELFTCCSCHERLTEKNLFFSHDLGGFLDEEHKYADAKARSVSPDVVKLLRVARRNVHLIPRVEVTQKIADDFRLIVADFSTKVLEREPKSSAFIKDLHAHLG